MYLLVKPIMNIVLGYFAILKIMKIMLGYPTKDHKDNVKFKLHEIVIYMLWSLNFTRIMG